MISPIPRPSRAMTRLKTAGYSLTFSSAYGMLRLTAVTPEIVRVRFTRADRFSDTPKPGVVFAGEPCAVRWEETEDAVSFETERLRLLVDKATLAVRYEDADGKLLLQENPTEPRTLEAFDAFLPDPTREAKAEKIQTPDGVKLVLGDVPRVFDRRLYHCRLRLTWQENEALYGLGQHEEGLLNLRGRTVYLHQANMKIAVPVLVSSLGYGLMADSYCPAVFRDDAFDSCLATEADEEMDNYFLYGGNLDGVVRCYRTLTGKAAMLPLWAFGFVQSQERYETAQELLDVVREYRRRGVGLDCIVLDWCTWDDGMWGQKSFDHTRFPDPAAMVRELHGEHARLMVSIWPNMDEKTADYKEFADRGLLLPFGTIYDALNPEARALYWEQLRRELYPSGVDAWWCDSSEPFTPEWSHFEKPDPASMYREYVDAASRQMPQDKSCAFALYHAQAVYEGQRAESGEKRVVNLTRSASLGQQRYGTILWSGDISASWETLRRQIAAGLSFCASGLPYWTFDIGGFFVKRGAQWFWNGGYEDGCSDPAYRELFARWYQLGAFLPVFRAHGTDTRRELWNYGDEGEPYYEAMKAANRLRYRLLPYLYSCAGRVWREDWTLLRLLAFDFPDDPVARETADEFLLGGALLVCPVTEPLDRLPALSSGKPDEKCRRVYLPAGADWMDYYTNERFSGGQWIDAPAPIHHIPLFVRAGSLLPVSDGAPQYAEEILGRRPEILVYPGADAAFTLYEDDGDGYAYESGAYTLTRLSWDDAARRFSAERDGKDVTAEFRWRVAGQA